MTNISVYIPDIAIAITTFKRQDLLEKLLVSIRNMTIQPSRVILVDNENSLETKILANKYNVETYIGMEENTGGAGGFSKGIEAAYKFGHEWIWVMDDDVAVLEDAIQKMSKWTKKTEDAFETTNSIKGVPCVYQGFKYNWDDSFFYWQYNFLNKLAIPNPVAPSKFLANEHFRKMNTMCFEGALINRRVVEAIGLPDARFFIYWDDTLYGYLASKKTDMHLMNDYTIRRTREIANVRIGHVRKLNSTSNMTRFYIMRNRGHLSHYLKINGDYNSIIFGFGTFLTLAKETIRLFVSKDVKTGFPILVKGMREAKKIRKDVKWLPYSELHPLETEKSKND